MKKGDLDEIRKATDTLQKSSHKLAEAMYSAGQSSGGNAGPGPGAGSSAGDQAAGSADDVIEAEVVEDEKR